MVKDTQSNENKESSYSQILKSSSVVGGAAGINFIIGALRTKVVAVLLGPSGVGLVGLYVSATGLVSTLSLLGINQSGVREIAEARSAGDKVQLSYVVQTLRRTCWITGLLGWILTAAFAWPIAVWTFGNDERIYPIAILGSTVLLTALQGSEGALLQGTRRIGDLARVQIISAIINTVIAIVIYLFLGEEGIIPVIILTVVTTFLVARFYSRRIAIEKVDLSRLQYIASLKRLVTLGLSMMYTGLIIVFVGLATRSMIVSQLGLASNGIYQSAWVVSGMFSTFILSAMGTDFYPRLAAVSGDSSQVNRLVNEQIEIGILLALSGIAGIIIFSHLVMILLFSPEFLEAAKLIPLFIIGVYIRTVSWPIGYILLVKRASISYSIVATLFMSTQLGLTVLFLKSHGLIGAALAFCLAETFQLLIYLAFGYFHSKFLLSRNVVMMILICSAILLGSWFIAQNVVGLAQMILGFGVLFIAGAYSIHGLLQRVGKDHKISKFLGKFLPQH